MQSKAITTIRGKSVTVISAQVMVIVMTSKRKNKLLG